MERVLTDVPYYQTYYFANAIQSVIRDQFGYLRKLHDFYGDGEILRFVRPFERHSAFHAFIEFLIDDILNDDLSDLDLNQQREEEKRSLFIPADCRPSFRDLPINHALTFFSISHDSFESWLKQKGKSFSDANADDAYDYYQDLRLDGSWEEL